MRRLVIDTDPGVDDALAILMALAEPGLRVEALTCCAGNVALGHTTANALRLLELVQADVPVYAGVERPLLRMPPDAAFVHGSDGFGDCGLPPPRRLPMAGHAALALIELSHRHAGELELICLGPLGNLALALRLDPRLPDRLERVVLMGGALRGRGNTLTAVEFNFGHDPEAAAIVVDALPRFELVDWELALQHGFDLDDFERLLAAGDHRADFYRRICAHTMAFSRNSAFGPQLYIADALAMAVLLEPGIVRRAASRPLAIELGGRQTAGMSVVDWDRRSGRPDNASLVLEIDGRRFRERVAAALGA